MMTIEKRRTEPPSTRRSSVCRAASARRPCRLENPPAPVRPGAAVVAEADDAIFTEVGDALRS